VSPCDWTNLELSGITDTGGQAKLLIQSGEVKVNGEPETRRRRKLVVGDVVEGKLIRLTTSCRAGENHHGSEAVASDLDGSIIRHRP
jgi:ribosome-associated protein YbcJ (S4-like RNA binding protein)